MTLRVDLSGLNLERLRTVVDEAGPEAVDLGLEHIRGVAVDNTPVETGRLAGSAELHVEVEGDEVVGSITYPGPYARYQHERLDLHHEHGTAKFLEHAVDTEESTALQIIANRIQGRL